ncbi:MAG: 2-C-methyl-D-erythritol 2,4-cyclodiphosphate synthase [Bacteroidales bacterium]|nr:2-C-methyl-D-erythritol 2,4-cyclodiphosphate synthase [Bacteroidales bacterium]
MNFRIGFGYDVHRITKGNYVVLGGVKIKTNFSVDAHSDGDVLIHAICDSLLGAANLRDIGYHFPNNSERYKNISSLDLLKKVNNLLQENNYKIQNIDSTIITEKPKISPYIQDMQKIISETLNIHLNKISIKATTNEKVGFIGREEGIAAFAVCLIYF